MIEPSNSYRIYLATQPFGFRLSTFDFRKGMDSSANYVEFNFELAHFSGAFDVLRATS